MEESERKTRMVPNGRISKQGAKLFENNFALRPFLVSISKWLSAINGIGIVISCSFAIAGYSAFMAAPIDCKVQQVSSDAIVGAAFLVKHYLLGGVIAFLSTILPLFYLVIRKVIDNFLTLLKIKLNNTVIFKEKAINSMHVLLVVWSALQFFPYSYAVYSVTAHEDFAHLKNISINLSKLCFEAAK